MTLWCLSTLTLELQSRYPKWVSTYPGVGEKVLGSWGKALVIVTQGANLFLIT